MGELLALLEEQQARIERLEARSDISDRRFSAGTGAEATGVREETRDTATSPSRFGRRGMMAGAAAVGTGMVAGLVAGAQPAGAATGKAVKLGKPNTEKTTTSISNASGAAFEGSSGSTDSEVAAVQGTITNDSPGSFSAGVQGINNGTGGLGVGLYGSQNGSGYGVYGYTPSGSGVVGESGAGTGVQGTSNDGGYGVYGEADSGVGVYGKTSSGTGVEGVADTGTGVSGTSTGGHGASGTSNSNYGVVGVTTSGNGVYGQVSVAPQAGIVGRQLDSSGNWAIYGFGNIGASGTKSAIVPIDDGSEYVTLYCLESPECWFEDFGYANLSGGSVEVAIDAEFAKTVQTDLYYVFLQAEGECKGLRVGEKNPTGFLVQELDGGTSDAVFAYRIVALRKDVVAPRLNRVTLPEAPSEVG
jgi:hypothetical protein